MSLKKVCLIIPAYNEEKRIGKTLDKYCGFFKAQNKVEIEILVVLNACKDNTLGVVKKFKEKYKALNYLNFEEGGKGFAISEGFSYAIEKKFDYIGFVDADGSTPPTAFYYLIATLGDYDGNIANRWSRKSILPKKQGIKRRIISRCFNLLVRSLLFINFQDTQCGAKVFRREVLEKILKELKVSDWAFDVNLLYLLQKNGYRIKEVETIWTDDKDSKVEVIKTSFRMFLSVIRLRFIYSPFERTKKIFKPLVRFLYYISK